MVFTNNIFVPGNHSLLAVWGRNDLFFIPAGAEAFKRGLPDAKLAFLNTGHFALETKEEDIAEKIERFF